MMTKRELFVTYFLFFLSFFCFAANKGVEAKPAVFQTTYQVVSPNFLHTPSPAILPACSTVSSKATSQTTYQVVSPASSPEGVKFAYLTDVHISVGTTNVDDLENSVKDINALGDIDFVILGGDITEFGSDAEILLAKSVLDKLTCPY